MPEPKVIELENDWVIRCRPCKQHRIPRGRWKFNGDFASPTFTPSVNESCNQPDMEDYRPEARSSRCHFVITDGRIAYQNDCSHELRGTTHELELFDSGTAEYYAALVEGQETTNIKVNHELL